MAISVSNIGGNLTINGSSGADNVSMLEVRGMWQINDGSAHYSEVVTGNMTINMGAGDDHLSILGGNVPGHLTVLMGDGNDVATINNTTIGTFLHFEGNSGNDFLAINNTHVSDPTFAFFSTIDMQDGNDVVVANNFSDQDLEVTLGSGNDAFFMNDSTFVGGPFQRLRINAGDGTDVVVLNHVKTGPLFVDMGPGNNDVLAVLNSTADTANFLDTGGTNFHHLLFQNHFGSLMV
jgi:hypothetical protein